MQGGSGSTSSSSSESASGVAASCFAARFLVIRAEVYALIAKGLRKTMDGAILFTWIGEESWRDPVEQSIRVILL